MKKVVFIIAAVFLFGLASVQAQITDISIPGDKTVKINTVYGGLLSSSSFSYDSLHTTGSLSILTGFSATYQPVSWLSFITANGYGIDGNGVTSNFTRFWTKLEKGNFQVEFGLQPLLSTEARPLPISADGQFESWTEATIPGGALGIKAKYKMGDDYIGVGVARRNSRPEYHFRYSGAQWKVSLYYPEFNKKFGAAVSFDGDDFYNIAAFNADKTVGNFLSVKINRQHSIEGYIDYGHDLNAKKMVRLEIGLVKKFSSNIIKGLIALAYNYESRSILGYLFVHI